MAKNLSTIDATAYFIVLGDTVPKRKPIQREPTED